VLVLWSAAATRSDWVGAEAQRGHRRKVLVAAAFDHIPQDTLPLPFNRIHTPDISDWIERGEDWNHQGWTSVLSALGKFLNRPLVQIAAAMDEVRTDARLALIRDHPSDPSSIRFTTALRAQRRHEFGWKLQTAREMIDERRTEASRKLDAL